MNLTSAFLPVTIINYELLEMILALHIYDWYYAAQTQPTTKSYGDIFFSSFICDKVSQIKSSFYVAEKGWTYAVYPSYDHVNLP